MDAAVSVFICFLSALAKICLAVAPDVCFQQFKWEDCGMPPKAVIYYYKSGSRCEVGFWRGCLPNPNMFADEYECVQTCIFSVRAKPDDYHKFQDNIITESEETTTSTIGPTAADNNGTTDTGAPGAEVEGEKGDKDGEGGGEGGDIAGGNAPAEGGNEIPAPGGGEAPGEGGGEAPAEGGDEAPAEGGGDAPAEGGGEAPAEGGGDAPADGEGDGRKRGGRN